MRRWWLSPFFASVVPLVLALALAGCAQSEPPGDAQKRDLLERIDASLASASRFLVQRQSPDGAWRSEVYGPLKDGPSLTPHVLASLYFLSQGGEARAAFHRGAGFLATLLDKDGLVDAALRYPAYSAAEASWVAALDDPGESGLRRQKAWIEYLRGRQLTVALGWDKSDPEFGGWGYSVSVPRKPQLGEPADPLVASNLSATVFGLGAMLSANVAPDDSLYQDVLQFAQRCQNYHDLRDADPEFDDGGFFFMPNDAARNKAGVAGTDRNGHTRFHSYGGATADGLRVLLHAGLPPDHPRVLAARRWLETHFHPASNPGNFEPDREVLRNATYYYYTWSVAHALLHLSNQPSITKNIDQWPANLANELLKRQRPDGSWTNPYRDTKEDDPLVATPSAAAALSICRQMIAEQSNVHVVGHMRRDR